ncbi:MAG: MFS transporter [Acidimicrobiales bacterium]
MSTTRANETLAPLSKGLTNVMAVAIGVIVASLYYLQPLLHEVTRDFRISETKASLLITLIQAGYAVGLAFIVPMGDIIARRRLALGLFIAADVVVMAGAGVQSFVLFAVITFLIGLSSVGGQVIITLGADMAEPAQRGRVIARLMTGLLIGLLLSRSVSGVIAQIAGWRTVYWSAGAGLAAMTIVLYRALPDEPVRPHLSYPKLIAGTLGLFRTLSLLRRRSLYGALIFAAFSALWTTLAFHLSAAPFHYDNLVIGLFGLFGIAGVLAANFAGRNADRQRTHISTIVCGLLILLSFVVLYLGRNVVIVLALGIVMLDAGMQGLQITNQSIIYSLMPDARSRVNSAYMVCAFSGAALGSFAAGQFYAHDGWRGDCLLGGAIGLAILVLALVWREPITTL